MRAAVLIYAVAIIAILVGWVMNLVKLSQLVLSSAPLDGLFIGRIVGIPVAILGAVLGWF